MVAYFDIAVIAVSYHFSIGNDSQGMRMMSRVRSTPERIVDDEIDEGSGRAIV